MVWTWQRVERVVTSLPSTQCQLPSIHCHGIIKTLIDDVTTRLTPLDGRVDATRSSLVSVATSGTSRGPDLVDSVMVCRNIAFAVV